MRRRYVVVLGVTRSVSGRNIWRAFRVRFSRPSRLISIIMSNISNLEVAGIVAGSGRERPGYF